MSRRNRNGPKLELKLNLSPPDPSQANQMSQVRSPSRSNTTSPSSCVSSETNQEEMNTTTTSMVLVGCPRCLMYVLLSQDDPKCPKCKSTVLLDFLHQDASASAATTAPAVNTKRTKKWWN